MHVLLLSFSEEQCRTIPAWGHSVLFEGTAVKITAWSQTSCYRPCLTALLLVTAAASPRKHSGCARLSGQLSLHLSEVFQKPRGPTGCAQHRLLLPALGPALEVIVEKFTLEEMNREVFLIFHFKYVIHTIFSKFTRLSVNVLFPSWVNVMSV